MGRGTVLPSRQFALCLSFLMHTSFLLVHVHVLFLNLGMRTKAGDILGKLLGNIAVFVLWKKA